MRITVWQYEENPLVSIDPLRFKTEAELVKALRVQNCPDEEFFVRVERNEETKEFYFDGSDGLHFIAVLCHRGLADVIFDLQIPCVTESARHKEFITPKEEVQIN
jgi:hypothetical protein